jgi:F-type H+-transporting ATPase subunit b
MIGTFLYQYVNEIAAGGLFDFDATLPFLMVQFVLLTFVLNIILYTPLLTAINSRNEYIVKTLSEARYLLAQADKVTENYTQNIQTTQAKAKNNLATSEKLYKQIWEVELETIQTQCDAYIKKYMDYLEDEKEKAFSNLEENIDALGLAILRKLFSTPVSN